MIIELLVVLTFLFLLIQVVRMGLIQYYAEKIYLLKQAPKKKIGLLYWDGGLGEEQMLQDRLMTAVLLYSVDGVDQLILGAPTIEFGQMMTESLLEAGILKKDFTFLIAADLIAFSRQLFEIGQEDSFVLLTQQVQLPRALFVCERAGLELVGVIADRHPYSLGIRLKSWMREFAATLRIFYLRSRLI